ncbi:MAG: MBL fold metallo-hydrolase [Aquiluna sp.]|nr:MBL fold metallo-hydrolase [Aquiluna sp.]MCF8545353.1 MBL fold metallo-hydrolase [Aquiluna sp.]
MHDITIDFLGAAGTVTGSKFLLTAGTTKVMVDCGLFQGIKDLRLRNWQSLNENVADIDAVVLTHAHLDHCGYLPKLVKDGFAGKIFLTHYTGKLAEVILRDSARIQTEDAKWAAKKGYSKHNPPKALYEEEDAIAAIRKFEETQFHARTQIAKETFVTFHPAGHILGAAFVELEFFGKRFLFSGDMGISNHPLLVAPDRIPDGEFDAVFLDSTYGDREHEAPERPLAEIINSTIQRGGSVLIPAFAVDRTEILLKELKVLMESGEIPRIPIYADSPMALKALHFYREAILEGSPEIRPELTAMGPNYEPFDPGTLTELPTVEDSKTINNPTTPCIVVSASGMATGGRVVHHLRNMLSNPNHTVVMVGYQAIGTRGRALVDGASEVKMHGEYVKVQAQIEQIGSYSVHADRDGLIAWLSTAQTAPKLVFLVHGEPDSTAMLAQTISQELGWKTHVPYDREVFHLTAQ